jgi:hypothetical protein
MPTPLFMHDAPTMKPSSMSPSQSLSRPSQRSGGSAQPQGWPQALGGKPSSTVPSQSSSMQLHASTAQWRAARPEQVVGVVGIVGHGDHAHMFDTPSSISPLQLSSRPLHTSAGGTVDAMMLTIAVFGGIGVGQRHADRRRRCRPAAGDGVVRGAGGGVA